MGCDMVSGEVNNQCWKKGLSLLTQPRMETQWPSLGKKQKKNPELYLALKISRDLPLSDQAITFTPSYLKLSSHWTLTLFHISQKILVFSLTKKEKCFATNILKDRTPHFCLELVQLLAFKKLRRKNVGLHNVRLWSSAAEKAFWMPFHCLVVN